MNFDKVKIHVMFLQRLITLLAGIVMSCFFGCIKCCYMCKVLEAWVLNIRNNKSNYPLFLKMDTEFARQETV